jgi:hypothetical protein
MPKQITRLLIVFVIFVGLFLLVRSFLIPDSFGDFGHYRANSIKENAAHSIKYVGAAACKTCHKEIDTVKNAGVHAFINCEACHGPGYKHIGDPKANKLNKPGERADCGKCHSKNASRPLAQKQVDLEKHNTGNKCIKCHNPHSPGMKFNVPGKQDTTGAKGEAKKIDDANCATCHSDKGTLKKSGVHKTVECQSCHGPGGNHVGSPASAKLKIPHGREFCGKCHGKGIAPATSKIKQVDLKEHNVDGVCTDCHNPHSPFKDF